MTVRLWRLDMGMGQRDAPPVSAKTRCRLTSSARRASVAIRHAGHFLDLTDGRKQLALQRLEPPPTTARVGAGGHLRPRQDHYAIGLCGERCRGRRAFRRSLRSLRLVEPVVTRERKALNGQDVPGVGQPQVNEPSCRQRFQC